MPDQSQGVKTHVGGVVRRQLSLMKMPPRIILRQTAAEACGSGGNVDRLAGA
jgi:hypothetical protein